MTRRTNVKEARSFRLQDNMWWSYSIQHAAWSTQTFYTFFLMHFDMEVHQSSNGFIIMFPKLLSEQEKIFCLFLCRSGDASHKTCECAYFKTVLWLTELNLTSFCASSFQFYKFNTNLCWVSYSSKKMCSNN